MFHEESSSFDFQLSLSEIVEFHKVRKLTFTYLDVVLKGKTHRFMLPKNEVDKLADLATSALERFQQEGAEMNLVNHTAMNLDEIDDLETRKLTLFEKGMANHESSSGPVFFSFIEDSSDAQAAGRLSKLEILTKRGWEFVDMSVVASDVGPGMRETHVLVKWKKG